MGMEQYILSQSDLRVPDDHVLSNSAIDFFSDAFVRHGSRQTQKEYLSFEFDENQNSNTGGVLIVTARDFTDEGKIGIYGGTNAWNYSKIPIANVLPYPISYASTYPINWGYMRDWFRRVYNLYFEEGELRLDGQVSALDDSDWIDVDIASPRQYLIFRCMLNSKRFVEDGLFRVVLVPPAVKYTSLSGFSNGLMNSSISSLIRRPE